MDLLSPPATDLQSSSSAFNASDSMQDLLGVPTNHSGASTIITVNSIADVVDTNDGVTTLREAINFANADTGEDVIVFDRELFSTAQTISLSLGELDITHNLSIIAPKDSLTGGDLLTVSGNNASRLFEIGSGATVNISGLVIADGKVTNDDDGGGVKNSGTLTLDNSIVRSGSARYGGGIYNTGTFQVNNSTLNGNSARDSGGGIYNGSTGTVQVSNSTFNGNSARYNGGGIYNGSTGTVQVSNSTLSGNSAGAGGGISNSGTFSNRGNFEVSNSTLNGNSAGSGGGIDNNGIMNVSNSTLNGNSSSYDSGGGIFNGGTVQVSNSTLNGNSARSEGGGIYNIGISNSTATVQVSNSTLNGNSAGSGGGIYNYGTGTVQVSNSTLSGNSAGSGGGIYNNGTFEVSNSNLSDNSAESYGGSIYNDRILTVSNSTLSGNSAANNGGGINNGGTLTVSNSTLSGNSAANNGGGISNSKGVFNGSGKDTVLVSNSTLSGNTAGNNGGGIFNDRTLALVFSTLTLNSAANGGGVFNFSPKSTRVRNTIIASNLKSEDGLNPDVAGSFTSDGYNLIGDGTGSSGFKATGDIVGTNTDPIDPRLGSLDANGGSTQTHALLESSPAIDAGDPTVLDTDPTTDQRGLPRVSGARADIGAFEFSLIV